MRHRHLPNLARFAVLFLCCAILISAPSAVRLPITALSAISRGGADMADEELTTDELLVEEVSIDGMCGVY
jgi:mycofactocin precursor